MEPLSPITFKVNQPLAEMADTRVSRNFFAQRERVRVYPNKNRKNTFFVCFFYTQGKRGVFFLLPVARKKEEEKSYFVRAIETATGVSLLPKPNFYFFFQNFSAFSLPTQHTGIQNSNQVYMPMNLALMGDNKIPAENDTIKVKKKLSLSNPSRIK